MQSTLDRSTKLHVGIIMDGNGRWAARRGLLRTSGHRAGIDVIRQVLEAAPDESIGTLSLFAFSADNWRRPATEIDALMVLLRTYLDVEAERLADSGIRLEVIGRRDRLPDDVVAAIEATEARTAAGTRLHLRVALDYSARDAIVMAAARCGLGLTREKFTRALGGRAAVPDVDLLIRTGGERRLSDFLLWECAYAELHFTDVMWPDFDAEALHVAVREFHGRQRRFGGLTASVAAEAHATSAAA